MSRALLDHRTPARRDRRRAMILDALDGLLQDGSLDAINVAHIAERAGLTRSAFYFYFENKGLAVVALAAQMYDEAADAANDLLTMEGPPKARIEGWLRGLVSMWEQNEYLYRAILDAREANPAVRDLWDGAREAYLEPMAAMIGAESIHESDVSSLALATVLLDMTDRAIERIARGDWLPTEERVSALVTIWMRTLYGTENV